MEVVYIILMIIIGLGAVFFITRFRMQRAVKQVIMIMRYHNAIDSKTAKHQEELGIVSRGMFSLSLQGRDYKPKALQYLLQMGIVALTDDFKYYLVEDKPNGTPFGN
ncbi:hypothetical protein ACFLTW_04830 [Chloroflexota bacterium]